MAQWDARQRIETRIQASLDKPRPCLEFEAWLRDHQVERPDGTVRGRFKFFVFWGPPQTGKSQYVRMKFKPEELLELVCTGTIHLDLRQYTDQKVILFDEATPELVLKHKLAFQASNAWCTMGTSPCNKDVYSRWFHGVKMIVCSNTWDHDLWNVTVWEDYEWLQDNSETKYIPHNYFFDRKP